MHEAYMVRKYLILILDLVDGKTLLDQFFRRHSATEDDVAFVIGQLCETLNFLHQQNVLHLDLRPTNIRFEGRDIKLLDYNSARHLANKKAGAVVDVIGDTEFCAPEMLNFDPVLPASDMWSVAIIAYILLSGVSPFFYEDEAEVLKSVQGVKYTFCDAFDEISSEAKDFIKKCLLRAPEMRMTAEDALKHPWLSSDMTSKRKAIRLLQTALDTMEETDARLLSEEEEDYVEASFVFRTFEEEEYVHSLGVWCHWCVGANVDMKERGRGGRENARQQLLGVMCRHAGSSHVDTYVDGYFTHASTPASLSHTHKLVETTVYTQEGGRSFRRWRMPPTAGVSRSTRSVFRLWQQQQQQQIWE